MVIMSSMQGLLNVAVYAWGHKTFRKYLREALQGASADRGGAGRAPLLNGTDSVASTVATTSTAPAGAPEGGSGGQRLTFGLRGPDSPSPSRSAPGDKFSRLGSPEKAVRFAAD
jgi:hypothetical protein